MAKKTVSKSKKVVKEEAPLVEKKLGFGLGAMLESSKLPLLVLILLNILVPFLAAFLGPLGVFLTFGLLGINALIFFWIGYRSTKEFGFSELHSGLTSAFCAFILAIVYIALQITGGYFGMMGYSGMMDYGFGQLGVALVLLSGVIMAFGSAILNFILGAIGGYLGRG